MFFLEIMGNLSSNLLTYIWFL